jgi:hypothetical protein
MGYCGKIDVEGSKGNDRLCVVSIEVGRQTATIPKNSGFTTTSDKQGLAKTLEYIWLSQYFASSILTLIAGGSHCYTLPNVSILFILQEQSHFFNFDKIAGLRKCYKPLEQEIFRGRREWKDKKIGRARHRFLPPW